MGVKKRWQRVTVLLFEAFIVESYVCHVIVLEL
jgi:hypothetical protein